MSNRILLLFLFKLLIVFILVEGCTSEPKNLTSEEKEGYELYKSYCQQCHRLQSPKLHTANEWPKTVNKMQSYMKEKNKKLIDNDQKAKIPVFLKSRARK